MMRRLRGFTLAELMVVLAIAGILLAAGVPSLRDMIERSRLRTTAGELFSAIDLTRSQAIARGVRVIMMPADALHADWTRGWVVFVDKNSSLSLDGGDELIFQQGPLKSGMSLRSTFASAHPPHYVAYNGAGRSCSASNSMASRPGTLSLVMGQGTRHIKINMLGRVRICDPQLQPKTCSGPAAD